MTEFREYYRGERHAFTPGEQYRPLIDRATGEPLQRVTYTRPDGSPLLPDDTVLGEHRAIAASSAP